MYLWPKRGSWCSSRTYCTALTPALRWELNNLDCNSLKNRVCLLLQYVIHTWIGKMFSWSKNNSRIYAIIMATTNISSATSCGSNQCQQARSSLTKSSLDIMTCNPAQDQHKNAIMKSISFMVSKTFHMFPKKRFGPCNDHNLSFSTTWPHTNTLMSVQGINFGIHRLISLLSSLEWIESSTRKIRYTASLSSTFVSPVTRTTRHYYAQPDAPYKVYRRQIGYMHFQ